MFTVYLVPRIQWEVFIFLLMGTRNMMLQKKLMLVTQAKTMVVNLS